MTMKTNADQFLGPAASVLLYNGRAREEYSIMRASFDIQLWNLEHVCF
jgi:hypothetical protein